MYQETPTTKYNLQSKSKHRYILRK